MLLVARWEIYKYISFISHLTHTVVFPNNYSLLRREVHVQVQGDKINCDTTSVSGQVPTYEWTALPSEVPMHSRDQY